MASRPVHRWALNGVAAGVTLVAVLGGVGVVSVDDAAPAQADIRLADAATEPDTASGSDSGSDPGSDSGPASGPTPSASAPVAPPVTPPTSGDVASAVALPADSGTGRRIVFDQSDQHVWLVDRAGRAVRDYPVSGSVVDNLAPGTYAVYSRSRWAVGVDDSGVMEYYVRFARGKHSTIGFHTIPTKNGVRLQTPRQLGTPQSHGCIRQRTPDAIALWRFAPVGTTVVVVA